MKKRWLCLMIFCCVLPILGLICSSSAKALSKEGWLWPIPEHKKMSRGYYSGHSAIDINAAYGTPVRATKDGFVIRIYTGCTGNYNSYDSCTRTTCAPVVYENFGAYSATDYRTYDGGIYGFEEKDKQGNIIHSWSRCNGGYGIGLLIYHPEDDSVSSYAHFSRLNTALDLIEKIKTGTAIVKQGDVIGYVGASGNAFGAHLHFQIGYSYGNWINNNPNSPSLGITSNNKTGLTTSSDGYSYNTDGVSYIFDYNFEPQVSLRIQSGANQNNITSAGTQVNFEFVSNCTQGVNGCYFDMYVWTKEDYEQGKEGLWVGVSGVNASYTFNESGDYYACARIHNNNFNIYSDPVIVHVDGIPPVISNIRISDLSNTGYTITCDVSDNMGVARVAFPTWTNEDWQDDIVWQDGILSDGTASFRVNISDHGNQVGKYFTYIYAYDAAGNVSEENDATRVNAYVDGVPPVVSNVRITDLSTSGYTVTCDVSDNIGVARVAFPTWTNEDWQDDIVWQDGTLSDGTASFRVNISDHSNQFGKYFTYVYAYDAAGNVSEENDSTRVNTIVEMKEKHYLYFDVNAPWNGSLPPTPFPEYAAEGERITISAIHEGYENYFEGLVFDHWESDNGGVFDNPNEADTVFTMPDCDVTICSVFKGKDSYILTITAAQGGYVSVTKASNNEMLAMVRNGTTSLTIAPDTTILIKAVPDSDYGFSHWICEDNHMNSRLPVFYCDMSYRDTSIEVVFKKNPYAMEEGKTIHLPDGLQVIESEAFKDVAAVYFDVPSSVRIIEADAFPPNSVVYLDTRMIEHLSGNIIIESGIIIEKWVEYNYEFAASLENTNYHYYNACGEVPE